MPSKKKDCSELAKLIYQILMNLGSRADVNTLDDGVAIIQKAMPELNRQAIVDSVVEATSSHAEVRSELAKKLDALRREAKSDKDIRAAIGGLEEHLKQGSLPPKKARPGPPPEPIKELREKRDALKKAIANSEPALREKYAKQIEELTTRLEEGDFTPTVGRKEVPQSRALEHLMIQRDALRQEIRQRIEDMKPRSILSWANEPNNLSRMVLLGTDFGQVLRQGKLAMGHPILMSKSIVPMFRAFASAEAEQRTMAAIHNDPDFPLANVAGLDLTHQGGALYGQEELIRSNLGDKLPGLKNFNRAYRLFQNKLRFDMFKASVRAFGHGGEVNVANARILANFVNVSTGRGAIASKFRGAMVAVNNAFLAPQFQISRAQFLLGQPLWGAGPWKGTGRARLFIAKEYARTLIGLGVYYSLVNMGVSFLSDDDEKPTVEQDPRSSDFGKIKTGNIRIDPLAGVSQWAVYLSRMVSGQTKSTTTGKVTDLRGEGRKFGGQSTTDVTARFIRGRLAPMPGAIWDKYVAGQTPDFKEPTAWNLLQNAFVPLTPRQVYDLMTHEGVDRGTTLSLMALFGEGVSRYETEQERKEREASKKD